MDGEAFTKKIIFEYIIIKAKTTQTTTSNLMIIIMEYDIEMIVTTTLQAIANFIIII